MPQSRAERAAQRSRHLTSSTATKAVPSQEPPLFGGAPPFRYLRATSQVAVFTSAVSPTPSQGQQSPLMTATAAYGPHAYPHALVYTGYCNALGPVGPVCEVSVPLTCCVPYTFVVVERPPFTFVDCCGCGTAVAVGTAEDEEGGCRPDHQTTTRRVHPPVPSAPPASPPASLEGNLHRLRCLALRFPLSTAQHTASTLAVRP